MALRTTGTRTGTFNFSRDQHRHIAELCPERLGSQVKGGGGPSQTLALWWELITFLIITRRGLRFHGSLPYVLDKPHGAGQPPLVRYLSPSSEVCSCQHGSSVPHSLPLSFPEPQMPTRPTEALFSVPNCTLSAFSGLQIILSSSL